VRARFCELLSPKVRHHQSDLFLVGLLSMMDAILEIPMEQILEKVHLDQDTKALLLTGTGPLRPVYQLMLPRESRQWQQVWEFAVQLGLGESETAELGW